VNDAELAGRITGKIRASPNPIPFDQSCAVISWETNDPAGVEVRISTSSGSEKLVNKGQSSGQAEIPWIGGSTIYDFRLYAASQPGTPIDSVKVKRDHDSAPVILRKLASEVMQGNIEITELAQFIATAMPRCMHSRRFHQIFALW
jgi:hypothetical protein